MGGGEWGSASGPSVGRGKEKETKGIPSGIRHKSPACWDFYFLMHRWSLGWCSVNPVHFGAGIFDMGLDLFPLFLFVFFMGRDSVKALFDCHLWLTASPVQPGL